MLSNSNDRFEAALQYARDGWFVFPAPPGQKKSLKSAQHSDGRKWGKTKDPNEIQKDWDRWPEANIGLPCGPDSGFWVLEADTKEGHNVDGIANLRALEERHGKLPPTRMATSPSGSVHYYFLWPVGGLVVKNSASRIALGVDVRGDGGMVIAPPSIRKDGQYRWLNDLPLAEAPEWLLAACTEAAKRPTVDAMRSTQVDLEKLKHALTVLPNPDLGWDDWNTIAMALYAATGGSKEGLALLHMWSKGSTKYNEAKTDERWSALHTCPPTNIGVGTIYFKASEACPGWDKISKEHFYSYLPNHDYIFLPTMDHWPASSVNSKVAKVGLVDANGNPILREGSKGNRQKTVKPTAWLDQHRAVMQFTWAPGAPQIVRNKVVDADSGWVDAPGTHSFNKYKPPNIIRGDGKRVGLWLDHCDRLLGSSRQHVVSWMAHRVQKPGEKINHALVLGGSPGIGKDTLLEPLKRAVGPSNFAEASPAKMLGQFQARYLQAVVLRINEARDLGDVNRYAFYEHMKTYTAAPPDVIPVNEKHVKEFNIFNCVGIIYTTNYKHGGIYLPGDDRRTYVTWGEVTSADFGTDYFDEIWDWYGTGGDVAVAAYLAGFDLKDFNPKAEPPKTEAFWEIVNANNAPEDLELADVLDNLGNPKAVTVGQLRDAAGFGSPFEAWLSDKKSGRAIPHRLEKCGYKPIKNPDSADGIWKVKGKRTQIYAKVELSPRDQLEAAGKIR
jgi:hypothetical protein